MKNIGAKILFLFFCGIPILASGLPAKKAGEFYQVTVYHFVNSEQQKTIEQYLEDAYLPALHRQKSVKVGVRTLSGHHVNRIFVTIFNLK